MISVVVNIIDAGCTNANDKKRLSGGGQANEEADFLLKMPSSYEPSSRRRFKRRLKEVVDLLDTFLGELGDFFCDSSY